MAEQQTPVMETPAAPVPPTEPKKKGPATYEQKQKRRKIVRRIVALVVAAAILGGGGWALKKYVFTDDEQGLGEAMTQFVNYGSIQSTVSGMGNARAKNSATVTPAVGSGAKRPLVLDLYIAEGDYVEEGQPLYNLDDTAALEMIRDKEEEVRTAQENLQKALDADDSDSLSTHYKKLNTLYEELADLTITAPHAGKLMDVNRDLKAGQDASAGEAVATIINDTKLRLHLYYSWAYEDQISVGQAARITLPASMSDYPATVEQVNYVKRIVPEGAVTFEVVFVMDNPGTLTEGMLASASLTGTNGEPAYPYESGKLEYYESTKITVKVGGPVESVSLMNYADVKEGQVLVKLGDKDQQKRIADQQDVIRSKEKGIEGLRKAVETAQEAVVDAQKELDNYHATAPISGQVISCDLMEGEELPEGASIYIADTATMVIDISIDERNIGYVAKGMMVDIQDMMGNYYMGIVDSVSLSAKAENGVAAFPAVVLVDNPDGMLMTNSYVDYTFVASQSDNCLIVPIQAVMNVTLAGEDGMMGGGDDFMFDDGGFMFDGGDMVFPEGGDDFDIPEGEDDILPEGDTLPEGGDMESAEPVEGELDPSVGGVIIDDNAVPQAMVVSVSSGMMSSSRGPSAFQRPGSVTVCFVKGEPDERAIEADEGWNMPEGFFAVIVETGLSDSYNVEIKSGLYEGEEVFTGYITDSAYSYGW